MYKLINIATAPAAISFPRFVRTLGVTLLFAGSYTLCRAGLPVQNALPPASPPVAVTGILIAERRTPGEAARRDIVNSLMKEAINNLYRDSGLYSVQMFSPTMSMLKQALLTHALESSDLDEPVKSTSLHKMARYFGARSIITFHAIQEKTGLKTDVSYDEIVGQDTWRTTLTNTYRTPNVIGKRKLKLDEMVDVNVDAIAKSLSVPSHLLADLHLEVTSSAPIPHVKTPDRQAAQMTSPDGTSAGNPTTAAAQSQTSGADTGNSTALPATATTSAATAKPGKSKKTPPLDLDQFTHVPDETPATVLEGARPIPSRTTQPQFVENITNEERAQRFRVSGDLASTILYLRHAVDDKPDDMDLRRKLIKAYQDDNASEMAVAEIGRSLRLDPKNGALYRIFGDAELALGNTAEAEKAYKQAVELDPKDVLARIALADMLLRDGQFDAALQLYHDAEAGAPTSPMPHRRLAFAACQRAAADPDQYAQALSEIKKARSLTAPIDTHTYLDDYTGLMKIMESRITDILEQLDNTYAAFVRGQAGNVETNRVIKDMSERATAASDFLDVLPVAAGLEGTHALYQEGTASLLSSIVYLKSLVGVHDPQFETKLRTEKMSARHDLTEAGKKLRLAKPAL